MATSFSDRMLGAAQLDVAIYEEVERDREATVQAGGVVALAAVAGAIASYGLGPGAMIGSVVSGILGWGVWSGLTLLIGRHLFEGRSDMGEMLRAIGFAHAPGLLLVLGVIPVLGGLVMLAVSLWMLACGVIAVRQALDFTTGKAIATVVIGWFPYVLLRGLMGGAF